MIKFNKEGTDLDCYTTICGTPKPRFSIRVRNSFEMMLKTGLDCEEIKNFKPITHKLIDVKTENLKFVRILSYDLGRKDTEFFCKKYSF